MLQVCLNHKNNHLKFNLSYLDACDIYNITHFQQNDDITINFLQNNILKLDRAVQCKSSSTFESTNGCTHHCNKLGYGQYDRITVQIQHDNGTIESCSIEYLIGIYK